MSAQAAQMRNIFLSDEGDRALAEALFDSLREATGDGVGVRRPELLAHPLPELGDPHDCHRTRTQ